MLGFAHASRLARGHVRPFPQSQWVRKAARLTARAGASPLPARNARFASSAADSTTTLNSAYDFAAVEKKWQRIVRGEERFANSSRMPAQAQAQGVNKDKYYVLSMFPYPSGALHLGHVRVYTLSDCIARVQRMRGYDVLHPMGWDSFGLPAENAAIEREVSPAAWTDQNIAQMRAQLDSLGFRFDWERGVTTSSPDYYRWTQWLFLQLHRAGLVYRKEAMVNWDPVDCTVLANEQVAADGTSWRSGAVVEQRLLPQWFIRTTALAEHLESGLDILEGSWPQKVRTMQQQWIGRSQGTRVSFSVKRRDGQIDDSDITVFTTRADTLMGVTFLAVSPQHPLAQQHLGRDLAEGESSLLPGIAAIHPISGESVPVFVADYVVGDYADGAVMGVPAHDERDHAFAVANELPIRTVVTSSDLSNIDGANVEPGTVINSGEGFDGLSSADATEAVAAKLQAEGKGGPALQYRLRDWLVSRQRYWGAPIPMVHCESCGVVPVPEADLPVTLPELEEQHFASLRGDTVQGDFADDLSNGTGLLAGPSFLDWRSVSCPKCGNRHARRETDTLDTFVDSSWYYLRYCGGSGDGALSSADSVLPKDEPFSVEAVKKWMPVDVYIGGIEHAILHLLYARLIGHFVHGSEAVLPESASQLPLAPQIGSLPTPEPFSELLAQGMVRGRTHKDPATGRYLKPEEVIFDDAGKGILAATGVATEEVWEKMSKSKYNGIDPAAVVHEYGADATRLAMLFKAPVAKDLEWDAAALKSQQRFLNRVCRLRDNILTNLAGSPEKVSLASTWMEANLPESASGTRTAGPLFDFDSWLLRSNTTGEAEAAFAAIQAAHAAIDRVTKCVTQDRSFNVAISEMMVLSNTIEATLANPSPNKSSDHVPSMLASALALRSLLLLMAPFAPHFAAEEWETLNNHNGLHGLLQSLDDTKISAWSGLANTEGLQWTVHDQSWPIASDAFLQAGAVGGNVTNVAVSVMGKFRGMLEVPVEALASDSLKGSELGLDEDTLRDAVLESDLARWIEGQKIMRTIVKPTADKVVVNFVLQGAKGKKKKAKK